MNDASERAVMKEGEVFGGGQRFRYREAGTGSALVCLGGGQQRSPMHALLAERYRVVELLLPEIASLSRHAIGEALAALGIERFDLVAHGSSAAPALQLALEKPEAVSALALLGPTLIASNGEATHGADEVLAGRLGQLKTPILAVFGTKDTVAPAEAGRHYRARIPACNLVFVYDAGHAMEEERPEAVAALLFDFLERHEQFLVSRDSGLIYP
jgi:pimeloyl-ACP methyl ester carboxylesterase